MITKRKFFFAAGSSNSLPVAKPISMIPNQGIGGYAITKVKCWFIGKAFSPKKIFNKVSTDFPETVRKENMSWPNRIINPMMAMVLIWQGRSNPKIINPNPMVAITSKIKV